MLLELRLYRGGQKAGYTYYYVGAQRFIIRKYAASPAAPMVNGIASELPTLLTAPLASCEILTASPPRDSTTLAVLSTKCVANVETPVARCSTSWPTLRQNDFHVSFVDYGVVVKLVSI